MPKFPKTVYVYWEKDGGDKPFLMASETPEETVEPREKRLVGVYELKKVGKVKSEVVTTTDL